MVNILNVVCIACFIGLVAAIVAPEPEASAADLPVQVTVDEAEFDAIFKTFETQAHWKPLVERARVKMASRDLAFRDALHLQLQQYVSPLAPDEFERFIGERSNDLAARLEEASDVMRRLKERDA